VVDHTVLLAKLSQLGLPDRALNWIISFLIHRTQIVKYDNVISSSQPINASIAQGSGLGPMLYVVMAKDLKAVSPINRLFNMLIIQLYCPVIQMLVWRTNSKMSINGLKTTA